MWVVQAGDDLYVRSAGGPERPWYVPRPPAGRPYQAGGIDAEVKFEAAAPETNQQIDADTTSNTTATDRASSGMSPDPPLTS